MHPLACSAVLNYHLPRLLAIFLNGPEHRGAEIFPSLKDLYYCIINIRVNYTPGLVYVKNKTKYIQTFSVFQMPGDVPGQDERVKTAHDSIKRQTADGSALTNLEFLFLFLRFFM